MDDHVVDFLHVELDLGPGEGVGETQLGLVHIRIRQVLQEPSEVQPNAAEQLAGDLRSETVAGA